jgi:hypothetical protein
MHTRKNSIFLAQVRNSDSNVRLSYGAKPILTYPARQLYEGTVSSKEAHRLLNAYLS